MHELNFTSGLFPAIISVELTTREDFNDAVGPLVRGINYIAAQVFAMDEA